MQTINRQRLALAFVLLALLPLAIEVPALLVLSLVVALLGALITYETISYGEARNRVRHELAADPHSS